jgi:L-alanine-DL-glutamate epimerase-like enolase superfamily enzyme
MPAPVSIAHVHVHALRLASGAEALVARVLTTDGIAGFGFSFGAEAFPARDMAAWDAAARTLGVPLYGLFGNKKRDRVAIVQAEGRGFDPFGVLLEEARSAERPGFLAPNAHPWEIAYCAALLATLTGEAKILVPRAITPDSVAVAAAPGIAIDWSLESAYAAIRWHPAER